MKKKKEEGKERPPQPIKKKKKGASFEPSGTERAGKAIAKKRRSNFRTRNTERERPFLLSMKKISRDLRGRVVAKSR